MTHSPLMIRLDIGREGWGAGAASHSTPVISISG